MKNSYLLLILLLATSCDFNKLNIDPNNPTETVIQLNQRLPSVEYVLANTLAAGIPRSIGNTMGQVVYIQGNTGLNTYSYSASDPSKTSLWSDFYSRIMYNNEQMLTLANTRDAKNYSGIAKIVRAICLGNLTSIWGDVPNSQIFKVGIYPNPAFDSQEKIYEAIQQLLDEAIVDLSTASTIKPASDDFIFGGDLSKWTKTAYSLKARYYLHTVKVKKGAYEQALSALANGIASNADNAIFKFVVGNPDQTHPLYNERVGTQNTQVDNDFTSLMSLRRDPRLAFYSTVRSSLVTGRRSLYGPLCSSRDSYVPIITYEECLFMKTEIVMFKSGKAAAEADFKSAVRASLERVCSEATYTPDSAATALPLIPPTSTIIGQYLTNQTNIDSIATDADVWKRIFEQKYIALFLQAEVWNDYRRASKYVPDLDGLPVLKLRAGNALPRRYNYTFNEINYNTSTPVDPGIFGRVWWDN